MAISVSAITPATGPITVSPVVITNLAGAGFVATPTVKLTKAGQSDINATSVVQVSTIKLTCAFSLTAVVAGAWDVVVTNPDTTTATLAAGFMIQTVGVPGHDRGSKLPKFQRTMTVKGATGAGTGGSTRPASGQMYPRGIK